VPLLLREWEELYPASQETVRSFLLRIRFLKSNKEIIKLTLGQHDLLPKMSQVGGSMEWNSLKGLSYEVAFDDMHGQC
jgi:hypothetical protein